MIASNRADAPRQFTARRDGITYFIMRCFEARDFDPIGECAQLQHRRTVITARRIIGYRRRFSQRQEQLNRLKTAFAGDSGQDYIRPRG